MSKYSFSVLLLNVVSTVVSGLGIWTIAKDLPEFADTSPLLLVGVSAGGTVLFQALINGGWRPFFLGQSGLSGALIGAVASTASLVSATAGWLMAFDSAGLQRDLQAAAVAPHQEVLLAQEQKYIAMAGAFSTLGTTMQSKAVFESTKGPSCQNDSIATWQKKCGPRCRFMNRSADLTNSMAGDASTLATKMSAIAVQFSEGSQAEIDAAYSQAIALPRTEEMSRLRSNIASFRSDLTTGFTDPETKKTYKCVMEDAVAQIDQADTQISAVLTLPPRLSAQNLDCRILLAHLWRRLGMLSKGDTDELRTEQTVSFGFALLIELLLLAALRRDARRDVREGVESLEPELIDAAQRRIKLKKPETFEGIYPAH